VTSSGLTTSAGEHHVLEVNASASLEEDAMNQIKNTPSPRSTLRTFARWAAAAAALTLVAATPLAATAERVAPLLECNTGPSGQRFNAGVSMPAQAPAGTVYSVRIDGVTSGKISHFGLNYLHDMTVDYAVPQGTSYVDGSAEIVPGTGTDNVLPGARVTYRAGVVTLALPAHVAEGTSYTPPSIRFQLRATGAPGSNASLALRSFRLTANAFLVGEVAVSCEPKVKPAGIGSTVIVEAVAVN